MRRAVALLAAVSLTACSMDPPLGTIPSPVPASWPAGDAYLRQTEATLPSVTYADLFQDPRLQALIAQALTNNRDLRVAAANIAAARAQVRITGANQLPQVNANADASVSGNDSGRSESYSANLAVPSFEIDLFGRLASLTRADQQRLIATEAGARAVRLALVADIAQVWANHAADASLMGIAERTAASAEKSVALTRARLEGGIAPRTDLLQAQQVLETARFDLASQKTALAQDVNALRLLVGGPVDPTLLPTSINQALSTFVALPAGLDSRVLLRRPDVVQAEYQLRASNAEIGAARAALFPAISLTGLLGFASSALTGLFSGGNFAWSAGAGATYPIFRAGAGRARVAQTEAQKAAALATYEKAIQTAFREVADALADRGTMAERVRSSTATVDATAQTLRLVDARYRGGIDPYLTSLDAQRSYYSAQRSSVAAQLAAVSNAVELYRTLGADRSLQGPLVSP